MWRRFSVERGAADFVIIVSTAELQGCDGEERGGRVFAIVAQ